MPRDLRAEIARARAEVTRLSEYIAALERAADLAEGLTSKRINRTVSSVNVTAGNLSSDTKRAAGRSTRKSEAQRRLYEKDMTITKLAVELGETRARVSKWFGTADENRAIPRPIAERLRDKYGIPLSAWSRISD